MRNLKKVIYFIAGTKLMLPVRWCVKMVKFQKIKNEIKKARNTSGNCIFIMATPCHGNLGDHAIVYAENELLSKCGYKGNVIEISNNQYYKYKEILKKHITDKDIIIIDGGGSIGTLWPREDDKISEIIDTYKANKIIVFPQTCYFDNDDEGMARIVKNKKIYENAKNLTITLRDKKSYDFCVENFKNVTLEFIPDIVLSLDKSKKTIRLNKALLCFRGDIEKVISDEKIKDICGFLDGNDIEYEKISTIYPSNIEMNERQEKLSEIWDKMSSSRILLTDRLHGMLFAAITGTPCLALDNKSKKVSGVYAWIDKLNYVKVCSTPEEIISLIPEFYSMGGQKYTVSLLSDKFEIIKKLLKKG